MLTELWKRRIEKCANAFYTAFITIFLTILPIAVNIIYNLFNSETWHTSITYAVAMSFLYSLIIPGFLGISSKSSYGKIHKAFQILSGITILSLYVLYYTQLNQNQKLYFHQSFLFGYIFSYRYTQEPMLQ